MRETGGFDRGSIACKARDMNDKDRIVALQLRERLACLVQLNATDTNLRA
jgi:hypothetical protein